MSRTAPIPMAGFQVIIYGRFWVITEDLKLVIPKRDSEAIMSATEHESAAKLTDGVE